MDYHVFKSMLNRYYMRHVGGSRRPVFFDVDTFYRELGEVTRSYEAIRQEFESVVARQDELPCYHDVDPGEAEISAVAQPTKKWTVFMLEILGHKPEENRARCPATCRALDAVPGVIQAFYSILDPGKSVPKHEGPYLGYLRYHLALRVPCENPPMFRIHDREYVWKQGEAILFDDTWPHEVVNSSSELRAVLVVDVLRPMPTLPTLVNRLTTGVIAKHTYGRSVAQRVREYKKAA